MSRRYVCDNDECDQFVDVTCDTVAGHQDWTRWQGYTLCGTCYRRYWGTGSLEKVSDIRSIEASERYCTYGDCKTPKNR